MTRMNLTFSAMLVIITTVLSTAARAELYWDTNGATAGGSNSTTAAGTWGTDNFWSTSSAGTASTAAWTANEVAVFSAGTNVTGTYDVTLDGTQAAGGITFEEGNVTITGGTELTLVPLPGINPDYNGDGTVDAADYVMWREGNLNGQAGYDAWKSAFGNPGGAVPGTISTINVAGSPTAATISSTIGGIGVRLEKSGAGTLTLNGANTYDGGTTVSGGKLSFPGDLGALGPIPAFTDPDHIILSGGGVLSSTEDAIDTGFVFPQRGVTIGAGGGGFEVVAPTAQLALLGRIAGSDKWTKSGLGELRLLANMNDFTAGYKIAGGTVVHNTGESTGTAANNFATGLLTSTGVVPASVIPDYIIVDGGTMKYTNLGAGSTFLNQKKGISLGANGLTIHHDENVATQTSITVYYGKVSLLSGVTEATLTKRGRGELRADKLTKTEDEGWDHTQLVVEEGLFRIAHFAEEGVLGKVPAVYKADAVVLNGQGTTRSTGAAAIGLTSFDNTDPVNVHNLITTTPATRGITVGANGATICTSIGLGSWVFESIITGPGGIHINGNGFPVSGAGAFATNTASVVFKAANSYVGDTSVNAGFLVVDGATAKLGGGDVFVDGVTADIDDHPTNVRPAAGKLRILSGVLNAIADAALVNLTGGGTALTADVGYVELGSGINETVAMLQFNGVGQPAGTYGATGSGATNINDEFFAGAGILTVTSAGLGAVVGAVPEPSAVVLLIVGGLGLMVRRRR